MSQTEKIAQVVKDHEFQFPTRSNPTQVLAVAEAAAAAAATGGMRGRISLVNHSCDDSSLRSSWKLMGPGGVVQVVSYTINVDRAAQPGIFDVSMEIGEYVWQKGSLFSGPTLNASKQLRTLQQAMRSQLDS
ncbi:MAG: hypothetical protein EBU85_07570 [Actinobacteria bacterium]|nr:hypothetical protein [Actinomycetota bacterium]